MGKKTRIFIYALMTLSLFGVTNCTTQPECKVPEKCVHSLQVHSTAYTCRVQRKHHGRYPRGAWGDFLKPETKGVAVSDDLIAMGLTHGTKITIEGLEGEYTVLDKMHARWKKTIDVYMGADCSKARFWGRRNITIRWETKKTPVKLVEKSS